MPVLVSYTAPTTSSYPIQSSRGISDCHVGEHPAQVDFNKNEKATETDSDGNKYEVWSEGTPYLLDVGKTKKFIVKEGCFIEIEELTRLLLTPSV